MSVRPKKYYGQHFLKDKTVAARIVDQLSPGEQYNYILEVGPGMGVLTELLLQRYPDKVWAVDIDTDSINYLRDRFPEDRVRILEDDFLKINLEKITTRTMGIIGNFPYNISSQIFFKILDHTDQVVEVVGMVQMEVGKRLSSGPGNKSYGILSVLLGAFYTIDYLFTVEPEVFHPKPKVRSSVIRLVRNQRKKLPCDEKIFKKIVKEGFQKRRKTLRNALKALNLPGSIIELSVFDKRAEQLTVEEFIELSLKIESHWKRSSHSN